MTAILTKALHLLPPEVAHHVTLFGLKTGLAVPPAREDDPVLATNVWGRDFSNPIGMAAGFDKNAEVVLPLLALGFGFVEAGTVTPRPQPGNPKPRLFRIPSHKAVINRLGFNNHGLNVYTERLAGIATHPLRRHGIVGANVGRNKTSTDAIADYVTGVQLVSNLADYVVINISSPNTPGLRGLQNKSELTALLAAIQQARLLLPKKPPLLVKIAPDLDAQGLADVAETVLEAKVDGLILGNTTISRPEDLPREMAEQAGGLSGAPLLELSNDKLRQMYKLTSGKLPLIGVGGVASAMDAYKKIKLGASLVQLYTGLIYGGPPMLREIKEGLTVLLKRDGFKSVAEAIGKDA
jgi:dihydroorotate dehydrogenase